jgi:hypothetical protein
LVLGIGLSCDDFADQMCFGSRYFVTEYFFVLFIVRNYVLQLIEIAIFVIIVSMQGAKDRTYYSFSY